MSLLPNARKHEIGPSSSNNHRCMRHEVSVLPDLSVLPHMGTLAPSSCAACHEESQLGFELSMAFQPIVNLRERRVFAYEALVRGVNGESAYVMLKRITEANRYLFDQLCRVRAIELASRLGIPERGAKLSINFMPGAVYSPAACIRRTLQAARDNAFPLDAVIFEITEDERVADTAHLQSIAQEYARHGFTLALDDFGAGYSGVNLLAELPGLGLLKLDGALVRGIDGKPRAQKVVRSVAALCRSLGIEVLGECVETEAECATLLECGVELMQGYLFAKPGYESLPEVQWPDVHGSLGETVGRFGSRVAATATSM